MTDAYQQIIDVLSRSKRVLVTTHVRPDGDALGTCAALVLAMRQKGIDAEVLLLSHLPTKYRFVFEDAGIVHHDVEKGWPDAGEGSGFRVQGSVTEVQSSMNPEPRTLNPFFSRFDCLLVADTGTWSQLPGLQERIANWNVPKLVLDHHLTQEDWADHKLVITEAAAAGEIAAELIELWDVPIDEKMATALYVALVSDTGWFQFSSTRPYTLRLAAMLMEAGVNTDHLYQLLYQNERPERIALQTRAMQSLELLAGGKLAVMTIRKADFAETKANVPDTENLINVPLQIRTVEVALLFTEPLDAGPVRVSLRSKGAIDVAKFAQQFAGGGHARAAGLKMNTAFKDAHDQVVAAMQKEMI
ncbi:MAG TPA: DHH family phosphoesterase [Tepidisphaeraceae bacterium]|jgi:phosphoesterase RecJ-like protein|nr:DHH family phosphoesterase [Tepidisphaeraceae bacterium]